MKGQFFMVATVIMIYTLMTMIQYIYDFSDINLIRLDKMVELDYIKYVKDVLSTTTISSNASMSCARVDLDLNYTENLLRSEMISRGISLSIAHQMNCPSGNLNYVSFNFNLSTPELFTNTQFRSP
jgi:hypothetical protein